MSFMPRTMRGVRLLRIACLLAIAFGAVVIYLLVPDKDALIMVIIFYSLACQNLLNRFERRFVDGFTLRRK